MTKPTRVVLVRHAESLWNAERRLQGHDGIGLSARGREQARRTAEALLAHHPDAVLASSDLQRAIETMDPVSECLRASSVAWPDLRDRDLGRWSGAVISDLERDEPDRIARWRAGADIFPEVGGESNEALHTRVARALWRLVDQARDERRSTVIVVSHSGPIMQSVQWLCGLPDRVISAPQNCSVTVMGLTAPSAPARLFAFNQTTHLDG